MKKILLTLGSIATVAAPIVAVVSCGDDNKTTTNPTTQATTISADAAKKIGEGLLADNRILNGIFKTNSMDEFVNKLVKLSISAQKELGEKPLFADDFTFSHSDAASVKQTATVIHKVISGLIDKVPLVGGTLKEKVTIEVIEAMLSEEHVTTGLMKLIHKLDIVSILNSFKNMQAPTLAGALGGFMPIGDHTAAAPVTMVVPNLDGDNNLHEPKFKQGDKVSLSSIVDISSATSALQSAGAGVPAPAATTTTAPAAGTTTAAAPTAQPLVKFDIAKDLLPAIMPNQAVDTRQIYGQDVSQSVLMTFLGTFLAELGSHEEVTQTWTIDSHGDVVKGKTGIVDRLVEALELMVVTDASGHPVSSGFSIGKDARLVNGHANTEFAAIANGVLDVDVVNTNHGATYMASTFEIRSKGATPTVLATKAAGQTNFVFKTNTLPVKTGTKFGGKTITEITVPQLVHSLDIHGFKDLVDIGLQIIVAKNSLILSTELLTGNMVSTATNSAQGGKEYLGMSINAGTMKLSLNGLATNASASDKEAYDTALTQFLFQVAGEPEVFAEITKQGAYAQAASMLAPIEVAEQHKRSWFVSYMEQMRAAGTEVTIDGHKVKVADAMQDVLDALGTMDFEAFVKAMPPANPMPFITHATRITDQTVLDKIEKAAKAIIETRNIGMLIAQRVGSGNV